MQDQPLSPTQPPYSPYNQPYSQPAQPVQQSAQQPYPVAYDNAPPARDWKMPAIVGGLIGLGILGGVVVLKGVGAHPVASTTNPAVTASQAPTTVSAAPAANRPAVSSEPAPAGAPAAPSQGAPSQPVAQVPGTNASVVGSAGSKNVRSGPGTNNAVAHIAYPGDRVEVRGSGADREGTTWYQVYFPQSKASGWMSSVLVSLDPGTPVPAPVNTGNGNSGSNSGSGNQTPGVGGNATIVGEAGSKNIRSGPGTNHGVAHIAYPGDRVKVLDSAQDGSGFTWYKVSFPKSGAQGWIAAQLLKLD